MLAAPPPAPPAARRPTAEALPTLDEAVRQTAAFVLATAALERSDRLWPADALVYETNPLTLAYGAAGVALFLHHATGTLPDAVRGWLLDRVRTMPLAPGLFTGAAGVAYLLTEIGEADEADRLLARVACEAATLDDPSLYQGLAGWGWANVAHHGRTGREDALGRAADAAERLIARSVRTDQGWSWVSPPGPDGPTTTHVGLGLGASGAALFFLALARATDEARYREAARNALQFDLAHAKALDGALRWGSHTDYAGSRPYWHDGTAGVGIVLVRAARELDEPAYLDAARQAAEGTRALVTGAPGRLWGMAGIGEFLLDLYHATGDPAHLGRVREAARGVLCFRVERPEGLAFPDRMLSRLSNDLSTGAAGCGLFLHRAAALAPRCLTDLP